MFMAPDSWRGLFETTLKQAEEGEIDLARLDDAVRRILRVKLRAGLFEAGKPSSRGVAGQYDLLQDPASKAIARQAVRESLVLLKNDGVLPLSNDATIVVAGDGVDNIGKQSGGWTLSWQGTGNSNSDFPGGSSMLDGIERHLKTGGGQVIQADEDGNYSGTPTVAVVVFGEDPYAEFKGDIDTLAYKPGDDSDLNLLKKFQAEGIPTVAVFLSGRPLWMNREINASNAFVAAWLPGSEGGYAMDVLFGTDDAGNPVDFKGKLSYSWPRTAIQTPLNYDDEDYDPLFAYGYGLTYEVENILGELPEDAGIDLSQKNESDFFRAGKAVFPWEMIVGDASGKFTVKTSRAESPAGNVKIISADDGVQENIRTLEFTDTGRFEIRGTPIDLRRQNTGDMALYLRIRPEAGAENGSVRLGLDCGGTTCSIDNSLSDILQDTNSGEWAEVSVKLSCMGEASGMEYVQSPVVIESDGDAKFSLSDIRLVANEGQAVCLN